MTKKKKSGTMTTEQYLATAVTEHDEQAALFEWRELAKGEYPELEMLYSNPNGGYRPKATAVKMKKEGTLAGVPDIFLPLADGGYHGLYIEMKKATGNASDVSDSQLKVIAALRSNGYAVMVCFGFEEAREALITYVEGEPLPAQSDISGVPNKFGLGEKSDGLNDLVKEIRAKNKQEHAQYYPIVVSNILVDSDCQPYSSKGSISSIGDVGKWVAIRPVSNNPENKTYLGILLGSFTTSVSGSHDKESEILTLFPTDYNPAIFIFDLATVVFGYESWWSIINDKDGLRQITDQDISNTWYVKALSQFGTKTMEEMLRDRG